MLAGARAEKSCAPWSVAMVRAREGMGLKSAIACGLAAGLGSAGGIVPYFLIFNKKGFSEKLRMCIYLTLNLETRDLPYSPPKSHFYRDPIPQPQAKSPCYLKSAQRLGLTPSRCLAQRSSPAQRPRGSAHSQRAAGGLRISPSTSRQQTESPSSPVFLVPHITSSREGDAA